MDRSRLLRLVERSIRPLMKRLGIPHWRIELDADLSDSNLRGQCDLIHVDYNRATISVNPASFGHDDDARALQTLRHELFHVVLSPYQVFLNAVRPHFADNAHADAAAMVVWTWAAEQAVVNLERMYDGLTSSPPSRPKPKPKKSR